MVAHVGKVAMRERELATEQGLDLCDAGAEGFARELEEALFAIGAALALGHACAVEDLGAVLAAGLVRVEELRRALIVARNDTQARYHAVAGVRERRDGFGRRARSSL